MSPDHPPLEASFPRVLARHAFGAIWWAALAPLLYPIVIVTVFGLVAPDMAERVFQGELTPDVVRVQWFIYCAIHAALFWRMTGWGIRHGVGPVGGPLNVDAFWIAVAIFAGPFALTGAFQFIAQITSQTDAEWVWRDPEAQTILGAQSLGPLMVAFTLILAPLVEEIAYRGYAMGWLVGRGIPPVGAAVVTSLFWAMMHFQYTPAGMAAIFLMGLFLGLLRVFSRGMTAPILAHCAANGAVLLAMSQQGG